MLIPRRYRRKIPAELQAMGNIDLQLTDKRGEDFVPPAYTAFSGGGASLGYVCEE
jgi:hypothetical protein